MINKIKDVLYFLIIHLLLSLTFKFLRALSIIINVSGFFICSVTLVIMSIHIFPSMACFNYRHYVML